MSGLRRAIRHPDRTRDPHVRAHGLLSDRFTETLAPADAAWLEEHLAGCLPCRLTAEAWAADRDLLRQLAATAPAPPRDLGARLAAALDLEEAKTLRRGRPAFRAARRSAGPSSRRSALALAGVAVAAIVALVVLPVALPFGGPGGSAVPGTTPVAVDTDPVAFARRTSAGTYLISATSVDRVCPGNDASGCGTLGEASTPIVALDVQPTTILLPAGGGQGVVVSSTSIYAISFPQPPIDRVTPPPASPSTPPRSANPTPAATGVPASPPVGTPVPTGSPVATGSRRPAGTPVPSVSPSAASAPPASSAPSATPASSVASLAPGTPAPTVATTLAILDNVVLVGGAPAYSPDGQWVAFSARPADGSLGPDVYVWRADEERARAVTDDHASVFSAWLGDRILASTAVEELPTPTPGASATPRPTPQPGTSGKPTPTAAPTAAPSETPAPTPEATATAPAAGTPTPAPAASTPAPAEPVASPAVASPAAASTATAGPNAEATPTPGATPTSHSSAGTDETSAPATPEPSAATGIVARSFFLDPATGEREEIGRAGIWRPVVDPSGRTVVFWTGTFAWSDADAAYVPVQGRLVTASWSDVLDAAATLDTSALPGGAGQTENVVTWDTRWDPAGRHLATWIGDVANGNEVVAGMLSLFAVDASGRPSETLLDAAAAMPGFSLGRDRLAWSTPPGRNGQGSLVGVFAWSGAAPGAVYSAPDPGSDPVVVVR